MIKKLPVIIFVLLTYSSYSIKGDPGRDLCKIVYHHGLKCSKISSHFFPYDTFLTFNDDLAIFTTEMKYLEIGNSNISVLQTRSFQRTPYLSHLLLHNISLLEIEPGAFEGLRRLKLVDLSENFIQKIPVDAFRYTKLSRLILDDNGLLEIPVNGSILNAPFLTSFGLKNCNIQQLYDSSFVEIPHLMHLDLSNNFLKSLPLKIFAHLQHLTRVDLSGNQFQTLDVKVFQSMPFFPNHPKAVVLADNPWVCDCKIAKLGDWLGRNVKTGGWSESFSLSRLEKPVRCESPRGLMWNTVEFQNLIKNSC